MTDLNLNYVGFSGTFKRHKKYIEEGRLNLPDYLKEKLNGEQVFSFNVISHDLETGLFSAYGNDSFGFSECVGIARDGVISFIKVYARGPGDFIFRPVPLSEDMDNITAIDYFGKYTKEEDDIIRASGEYQPIGFSRETGGTWSMEYVQSWHLPSF